MVSFIYRSVHIIIIIMTNQNKHELLFSQEAGDPEVIVSSSEILSAPSSANIFVTDLRRAKALARAPFIAQMEEPDPETIQELQLMQRMGLPTCFLNSPRDLDSDEEVCTACCICAFF